jgi:hypothetical protein
MSAAELAAPDEGADEPGHGVLNRQWALTGDTALRLRALLWSEPGILAQPPESL